MFCKKSQPVELPPIGKPAGRDSAQLKELNHEFFLLVRDQKYEQAYAVGTMYLQYHPDNQAVLQFCHFIKHNREELRRMLDEQNNYTDDSGEEEDDDDDEDDEDSDDAESVVSSQSSVSSKASTIKGKSISSVSSASLKSVGRASVRQSGGKENAQLCRGHKWDHNCKNKDCPNRKKQQKK